MLFVRMDTLGYDGVFSHTAHNLEVSASGAQMVMSEAGLSLIKSTALAVFPILFIFLPLGIFGFFRNRNFDKYVVLSFLVFLSLPVIYAAMREISDPRYFLALFPILSLFSFFSVKEIISRFDNDKLIMVIVVTAVLSLSIVYLDYTKLDYQHELDAYHIGLEIHKRTSLINEYPPEDKYVHNKDQIFWNIGTFPVLQSETERKVKVVITDDHATCAKENELESLVTSGTIMNRFYEKGNWGIIFKK